MGDDLDLVSKLSTEERDLRAAKIIDFSPDDSKYASAADDLVPFLSAGAEWKMCARVQQVLRQHGSHPAPHASESRAGCAHWP